jgi:hypothetical protein
MVTAPEAAWLDYAWTVVNCGEGHLAACESKGGADPSLPGRTRYPGNLGSCHDDRVGILCVSLVHKTRDPDAGAREEEWHASHRRIADAIGEWQATGRSATSDETYLASSRAVYEDAIPTWPTWWNHFKPVLDHARLDWSHVAYTNLAKCRADLDVDDRRSRQLAAFCQSAFPVQSLVAALRPAFVLVATTVLDASHYATCEPPPRVTVWDGRTAISNGDRPSSWRPLVAGRIRSAFARLD